jgi:SAM-dependent methyltransferase
VVKDFNSLYDSSYFENRKFNDKRRLLSFEQEKKFLEKYMPLTGVVCDIGCSTGEFLSAIRWSGPKYGMEVNNEAITLAKKTGISFEKDIQTEKEFFDSVIFRGTIQHLPDPFNYIQKSYDALKKGGYIVFLATPNANSWVYKIFNTLPALVPKLNFYIPSDKNLSNILQNYDFELIDINRPYLDSPYSKPALDHLKFIRCLATRKKPNFAFWGSMMDIIAVKR